VKRPLTPRELRTVIESIHLKRFKNFQDVTLELGPLTILIGANAALPRGEMEPEVPSAMSVIANSTVLALALVPANATQ
jgi:hypothetical protein